MTDLLSAAARRTSPEPDDAPVGRSLLLTATVSAVTAAGSSLLASVAFALAGWFAADAGRYGDTRDALRVGADAWLLAHGAGLRLDTAAVTVLPLGLTLLCAYVAYRAGRRAARAARLEGGSSDLRSVLTAVAVHATLYAVLVLVTAVLAADPRAESGLMRAVAGGFLLALVAGGSGLLTASGHAGALVRRLPSWGRSVLLGTTAAVLLLVGAAAFLLAAALLADFGTAATVLSRLHWGGSAGLMYTAVGIAFIPNAVLLTTTYLLGPGFAVGTGTVVSPTAVILGPVPAFPLLAALPADGATPGWTTWLMALPVVLTAAAVVLTSRLAPLVRLDVAALAGLGAGLATAVVITVLVTLAGGAAGPGRMTDVGAPVVDTFLAAAVSCGGGGLVGGLLAAWQSRRRLGAEASGGGTVPG